MQAVQANKLSLPLRIMIGDVMYLVEPQLKQKVLVCRHARRLKSHAL